MIRFVCRSFPLFSDTIFLFPSFTPLFTPLHRRRSSFIPPFKTWSPLLASCCLFHLGLLALIHAVVCTLHSQDSLLPLCGQTFMPAVVSKPPLPHFSASPLDSWPKTPSSHRPVQEGFLFLFLFWFNSFATAFFSITRAQTTENKHRR